MASDTHQQRRLVPFRLRRADPTTWIIEDPTRSPSDPTRIQARITEIDETGVRVTWMSPLPLPTSYLSAAFVLEDLERWRSHPRATRPVPIPHMPPRHPELC